MLFPSGNHQLQQARAGNLPELLTSQMKIDLDVARLYCGRFP